jgi:tRNA dimethylallyltransferase
MASTGTASAAAVVITGPTASGKSALALALAERTGGWIVNADSMQVYRELRVLTARPGVEDEARVPHRLYGDRPAAVAHAVADWLRDVDAVLLEAEAAARPVVLVGGTGLYHTALTAGLSSIPPVPDEIRARWRAEADRVGAVDLHGRLALRDPVMAERLRPGDTQRIVRALEVLDATGCSLASFQGAREPPVLAPERIVARLVVAPGRADLHRRIDARFRAMVEAGGLEEADRLAGLGLDPSLPAMKAIGVPEMIAAARGAMPLEVAIEAATAATRRYAKRQETWFRNQMPDWTRVPPGNFLAVTELVAQQVKRGLDPSEPGV